MSEPRRAVLDRVARMVGALPIDSVPRVAVDGVDAGGKTTLADEVAPLVARHGRQAIRVSLDDFHRPRADRHARGELDPDGYYEDAFDLDAFVRFVLEPLGPGGSLMYRTRSFDLERDEPVSEPMHLASSGAVLLTDGVFLLREELRDHWDFALFVDAHPEEVLRRAIAREPHDEEHVRERYARRYLPAHERYEREVGPRRLADVVLENTDPAAPVLSRVSVRAMALEGPEFSRP